MVSASFPSLVPPTRRQCDSPSLIGVKRSRNGDQVNICKEGGGPIPIRNPRALFPVRDDFIRSAWVRRARTKRAQEYEDLFPYFPCRSTALTLRDATTNTTSTATATPGAEDQAISSAPPPPTTRMLDMSLPSKADEKGARETAKAKAKTTEQREIGARRKHHMGVGTGPVNAAELRRAFRRLEPEKMFRAPRVEGEPIWAYWGERGGGGGGDCGYGQRQPPIPMGKRASTKDGFVLVPAKELGELRALEGALRKERGVLDAHCLIALNEGEVSAHRPLELTRRAVHDACGREMATALRGYRLWMTRNRKRIKCSGGGDGRRRGKGATQTVLALQLSSTMMTGYVGGGSGSCGGGGRGKRSRDAASKGRVTELQKTPVGWRYLRWTMMKREAERKSEATEATAMHIEEMEQRHKERYLEAWERCHDYDLYCVLAGQFWPLDVEAFRASCRPGKKLFLEISAPARVINRMWKTCWPFRKDRKRKGCIGLQALWRGYRVRRRWRPIVRLRLRHGRRSLLGPCFLCWARVARVQRWARRRFDKIEGRWNRVCFHHWVEWTATVKVDKHVKLERAGSTLRNIAAYRSFRSWQFHTKTTRQANRLYARAVGGPAMAAWIRYLDDTWRQRKQKRAAVTIQRHARGYLARGRHRATRTIIRGFNRLVRARRDRQFLRNALAAAHCMAAEDLLQSGFDAEITAGIVREEKRLAKLQKELKAVEVAVRRTVTNRLKGGWLSSVTRLAGRPSSLDGGELRREIKAVRKEWRDLKAKAETTGLGGEPAGECGGGNGGGIPGRNWLMTGLAGFTKKSGHGLLGEPSVNGGSDHLSAAARSTAETTERGAEGEGGKKSGGRGEKKQGGRGREQASVKSFSHSTEEVEREARRRIYSRYRILAREITVHDFDVRNPPPLKCCAPGCDRTFTEEEHYLAHWGDSTSAAAAATKRLFLRRDDLDASSRTSSPSRRKEQNGAKTAPGPTHPSDDRGSAVLFGRPTTPAKKPHDSRPTTGDVAGGGLQAEAGHPQLGGEPIASFHLVVARRVNKERVVPRDEWESDLAGFDLVSTYITRIWGRGQAYNTLLFVDAVDAWRRRWLATEPGFLEGAIDLWQRYLCPEAPHEACVPAESRENIELVLGALSDEDEVVGLKTDAQHDLDGSDHGDGDADDGQFAEGASDGKKHRRSCSAHSDISVIGRKTKASLQRTNTATAMREKCGSPKGGITRNSKHVRDKKNLLGTVHPKQQPRVEEKAIPFSVATALTTTKWNPKGLRPTSFDEAQFQALAHLSQTVGPGFWDSDLGRKATALHLKDVKRNREVAHEIVRLERTGRMANEAAEVKKQLLRAQDAKIEIFAQRALEAAKESVVEALLRSAVAGAELLEIRNVEMTREAEMIAEAATVEAVWVVEPPLLGELLEQEIDAFFSEGEEQELMALEDDWVPPEVRLSDYLNGLKTTIICAFDIDSVPGGEEGARQAATTIQLAWRQRSARVEARRRLAKVYVKRAGHMAGEIYYENIVTGESQWERPMIANRLFPYSSW